MMPAEVMELRLVPGVDETTRSLELSVLGGRRKSAADLDRSLLSAMAAAAAAAGESLCVPCFA